ncbi:HD domain-containing protein [Dictyobacter aurantiacus]|uniref:5'-deoxynucleotidase n=1 Tax=Dictyobacter aurantiacus TaxID=1936993 RepID=A0A401ZHE9_9CHLR|nr:HD domain-containing protein [Dictyobacter aurantiacus]GCE06118.1 haloacid dehalogenase [Dictyobacter aurantiacus]
MDMNNIAKYLYEIGQLKRVKRSGWWMAGITDPESVAEHTFRTAILGYVLASLDGADPAKTAMMCLFHDTGEARINDLHRVSKRYINVGRDEERAITEQVDRLPQEIAANILSFFDDYEGRRSPEGILARDADLLECIVQAREYQVQGYPDTQDWITNCYAGLQTDVAKNLAEACLHTEPKEWWQGLKIK